MAEYSATIGISAMTASAYADHAQATGTAKAPIPAFSIPAEQQSIHGAAVTACSTLASFSTLAAIAVPASPVSTLGDICGKNSICNSQIA